MAVQGADVQCTFYTCGERCRKGILLELLSDKAIMWTRQNSTVKWSFQKSFRSIQTTDCNLLLEINCRITLRNANLLFWGFLVLNWVPQIGKVHRSCGLTRRRPQSTPFVIPTESQFHHRYYANFFSVHFR